MNKIIILCAFVITSIAGISQTTTEIYNTPYQTTDQSLWQQGDEGIFEIDYVFFDQGWNTSTNFGPIYSVAGMSFGANITAGTWGSIGAGFQVNFGTEKVDIDYNADMKITRPADLSFDPGDEIILNTTYTPHVPPQSTIETDVYDANMRLWLKFGMGILLHARVCVFGCSEFDIVNINMPVDTFDMISVGNLTGISLLNGMYEWPASEAFPFEYTDPEDIITVDITLPSNAGANIYLQNNNLHSFVNPSEPYFNAYFSIPKFIGALHIPYVSAFFANLSNSWTAGPFYLNYTLMEAGFNLGLYHKQHLTLKPDMKGELDFPTKLDYQVFDPSTGTVITQGFDSVINYTLGNSIRLQYPCNYDFIEVTPSFSMENTFTNHTYDSIALDFVFEMLTFNMGMNAVTVIPQICIPIYYPCPTWSNPFRWCSYTFCTPPVVFGGFNVGFGPLVYWQPNLFNIKYDWCNNTWNMEGFEPFNNMTPFRLEPRKFNVNLVVSHVLCHGDETGSATATVSNGNPPYVYEWSNGVIVSTNSTSNTQTGLAAGTHYVIVRDSKNCSVFASEVIVEPELPLAMASEQSNPNCFDSYDGSIQVIISGGTPDYTYSWNNGSIVSSSTNLDAGTYLLTVTDFNGCQLEQSFSLIKPEALSTIISTQNVLCKGDATGSAIIEVFGGIPDYLFSWTNGNTTHSDLALHAGSYTVTITDFNSCQKIETIEIIEPDEVLSFTNSVMNVDCYGNSSGSINTITSGGTAPYTYEWFNSNFNIINQSSAQLLGMMAGNYRLIVTDNNHCSDSVDLIITQPDSLFYEFNVLDVLCKGNETGEITANISGATPPYSYSWSNGSNNEAISNLVAGNFWLTITDLNNCEYVMSTSVFEPIEFLNVITNATDVLCKGDKTGSITASPSGGTWPYTYIWSNGLDTQTLNEVFAGTYTVTVTDAHDCIYYSGSVVAEPEFALSISTEATPVSCFGGTDGSLMVNLNGGTIPYRLTWNDNTYIMSTNQQSIDGLESGIFNLLITDANNCFTTQSYLIESPDTVIIDLTSTIVSCYKGDDGTITMEIDGGTEPYTYIWSNGATNDDLVGITAGNYEISVTDANECEYSASTVVKEMDEIVVAADITQTSCKDKNDAEILLTIIGGTGNYFFIWTDGSTSQNVTNLAPGTISVIVSDDNHCEISLDFLIETNSLECLRIPSSFSPNNDGINDIWVVSSLDLYTNASVQIFNKWGNILYDNQGIYIPWDGKFNGNHLPADVYYYIIDLNNGDSPYTGTITILR